MPKHLSARCVVTVSLILPMPLLAQEIESIDFDTIPSGTRIVAPEITLQGDTVVQGGLQLSGNFTLGPGAAIIFAPPRTGSLLLAPADFAPKSYGIGANLQIDIYGSFEQQGPEVLYLNLIAPLHLPAGAELIGSRCWFYDNDPDIDFVAGSGGDLCSKAQDSVNYDGCWIYASLPGGPHQADALIEAAGVPAGPIVIQPTKMYWMSVHFQLSAPATTAQNVGNFRFYGCRVDYEVSTWTP